MGPFQLFWMDEWVQWKQRAEDLIVLISLSLLTHDPILRARSVTWVIKHCDHVWILVHAIFP